MAGNILEMKDISKSFFGVPVLAGGTAYSEKRRSTYFAGGKRRGEIHADQNSLRSLRQRGRNHFSLTDGSCRP